jgi:dipeptidyl-peptidase 4
MMTIGSRSRRTIRAVACALSILAAVALHGQQADRASTVHAQIDRIFKERVYDPPRFGPARWLPDGSGYTVLDPPRGAGSEIVRYDGATGERTVLVASSRLVPPGAKSPLDIDDYAWSPDGRRLLVFTNTQRVWRQNTRGDYWVLDVASGALKKIGAGSSRQRHASQEEAQPANDGENVIPGDLMFAKFSPDSSRVGYVRANNIYVERLDDGRTVQLTKDGSQTTINGTSDWVYEEELNVRDGFRWSPDGRNIAYWQFDTTGVSLFTLVDDTTNLYPTVKRFAYPKVGTTNSAARVGVVSASGGRPRWMNAPGDPRNNYIARVEWVDPQTIAIEQLNRLQNRNDLLLANAATGEVTRVFRDESRTWVEVVDEVRWIDGGRAFLWITERDGWQHVSRVPRQGGDAKLITRFDGDVIDVAGTDEAHGWLYFLASPTNATERYLYRSKLDGSGQVERITPANQPGSHSYDLAPGGRLAFHTWSQFDRPPMTEVVELPSYRSLRVLTDPSALSAKLREVLTPPVEFLTVDVGAGVTLDGYILKPSTFDASRKYPVIVHVYGEPAGQTVVNRWGGRSMLFHRALAQAGYIVVSFDNRGTPAPKGAAWRKVIYGTVGDLSSGEQAAAIRALAARYAFIDLDRLGIWGWSGGGTNTLNAMFRFPDLYKVGVSVAPVPDQRLYDTIYQERYMGLPTDNAEGYRIGSAINFAEGLKGKLLIVHGSGDDNVHYQGTERLVNRLVELGKPFDLMVYPNRTHAIAEGPGTAPHVYHLIARYFLEHLRLEPMPRD